MDSFLSWQHSHHWSLKGENNTFNTRWLEYFVLWRQLFRVLNNWHLTIKHPDKNSKAEKGCFIGTSISFLFLSREKNRRWESERRETVKLEIWTFWAQMANDRKLGAVPTWNWNISYISSNTSIPLFWIIELFNCVEKSLTRHFLSTYSAHCILWNPTVKNQQWKTHSTYLLRNRLNRKKTHKWWIQGSLKVHNRKPSCKPRESGRMK